MTTCVITYIYITLYYAYTTQSYIHTANINIILYQILLHCFKHSADVKLRLSLQYNDMANNYDK